MCISNEQLRKASAVFAGQQRIDAAYVLGSAVNGPLRSDSDIDIAILPSAHAVLDAFGRIRLGIELEKIFMRQVDIGILDHNNLIYAKEAYLNGRRIYCRDTFRSELFGASALGMYAELREARKEVESAYEA